MLYEKIAGYRWYSFKISEWNKVENRYLIRKTRIRESNVAASCASGRKSLFRHPGLEIRCCATVEELCRTEGIENKSFKPIEKSYKSGHLFGANRVWKRLPLLFRVITLRDSARTIKSAISLRWRACSRLTASLCMEFIAELLLKKLTLPRPRALDLMGDVWNEANFNREISNSELKHTLTKFVVIDRLLKLDVPKRVLPIRLRTPELMKLVRGR